MALATKSKKGRNDSEEQSKQHVGDKLLESLEKKPDTDNENKKLVSIYLTPAMIARIDKDRKRSGISRSSWITQACDTVLEQKNLDS
jgi:hypothetical protein